MPENKAEWHYLEDGECSKPIAWMPFPEPCGARK